MNSDEPAALKPVMLRDNSGRGRSVIQLFYVMCVFVVVNLYVNYLQFSLLERAFDGENISDAEYNMNIIRRGIAGLIYFGFMVASAVLFLNWMRRAYANLKRAGIGYLRFKESMVVWAWFIPFVSLYRPVQIMNELWTETQEKLVQLDTSHTGANGDFLIGVWWVLFLVGAVIGNFLLQVLFNLNSINDIMLVSKLSMILDLIDFLGIATAIVLVKKISSYESQMARLVRTAGGTVVIQ